MQNYVQLLRQNPSYTRLWIAQVISLLGDWFSTIVLVAMVREFSAGARFEGLLISALFLSQTLPPLVASPLAGWLVDRFNRKWLLIGSNLLRAGVVVGFLFINSADRLWLLFALRIVQFGLSTVFEPGQSALIPSLVPKEDLTRANTLMSTTWSVMLAVGAIVGGIVSAVFGQQTAIIVDVLTFLVAGSLIMTVQVPEKKKTTPHPDEPAKDRSFMDAVRYFWQRPTDAGPLFIKFGISVGNIDTVVTFYATQIFVLGDGGELSLGLLYSAFGVGALAGPLLLNRFHNSSLQALSRSILLGFIWIVLGWLGFGIAGALWMAVLAMALRAMGNSVNWVYGTTIIQKTVPDHYLGRAFAIDMAGFYFASVLSTITHGLLIDLFGSDQIRLIVIGTAIASTLPLIGWYVFLRSTTPFIQQTAGAD